MQIVFIQEWLMVESVRTVFVNKVFHFYKRPSPFFLATPHALAAGSTTPL
jgi:hypothetical protein